jgi:uncharacterized protein (DUF169 family)
MDRIGITIFEKKPTAFNQLSERFTHCRMVSMAREGKVFYSEPENFKCPLSRFALGLQRRVDAFKESVVKCLISWGHCKSEEEALAHLESKKPLRVGRKYILYFPLDKQPDGVVPHLVLLIGTPAELMSIIHKMSKALGEVISSYTTATSSICGEVTAFPLTTGAPNLSLGCCGARGAGALKQNELVMGIPMNERYRKYGVT